MRWILIGVSKMPSGNVWRDCRKGGLCAVKMDVARSPSFAVAGFEVDDSGSLRLVS